MLKDYEINRDTIAIIPIDDNISKVYESETEYIVNKNVNKIIDINCRFYGSSYKGRCEGTRYLTGIKSKCPIVIDEVRNIIFFPTSSVRNKENCWISLNNLKRYDKTFYGCRVTFQNNKTLPFDISLYSMDNQFFRAILLKSKMDEKKTSN